MPRFAVRRSSRRASGRYNGMTGARHGAWPCLCPDAHEPTPRTQPRSRRWHRPQGPRPVAPTLPGGQCRSPATRPAGVVQPPGAGPAPATAAVPHQPSAAAGLPVGQHASGPERFRGGRRSTRRSPAPGPLVCLQATQAGTRTAADPRPVPDGQPGEPGPGGTERSRPLGLPCPRTGARRAPGAAPQVRVDRGLGAQPGQRGALFPDRRRPFRPGRTQRLERVRRRRQYPALPAARRVLP